MLTSLKAVSCSHWNRWQWFLQFAMVCLCTSQPGESKNAWLLLCHFHQTSWCISGALRPLQAQM